MKTETICPQAIRADGFRAFEGETTELQYMAEIAMTLFETFITVRIDGETVTLRTDTVRMIDYAVARVASMAEAIDRKWSEAHNRACEVEIETFRQEREP